MIGFTKLQNGNNFNTFHWIITENRDFPHSKIFLWFFTLAFLHFKFPACVRSTTFSAAFVTVVVHKMRYILILLLFAPFHCRVQTAHRRNTTNQMSRYSRTMTGSSSTVFLVHTYKFRTIRLGTVS